MKQLYWLLASRFLGGLGYQIFVLSGLYQIYRQTQSAAMAGLVGLVLFLPVAIFTLFLGQWADQIRLKAKAYFLLQAAVAALGISFFSSVIVASHTLILAVMFCYAVLRAARTPFYYILMSASAAQEKSPVSKGRLAQLSTLSWQGPLIFGPFLFSFLQVFGGKNLTAATAVVFFMAAAVCSLPLLSLTLSETPRQAKAATLSWETLFRQHPTWLQASLIDVLVMGSLTFVSLMPFLLTKINQDPAKLGYLRSSVSLGAFLCVWIFEVPVFKQHRKKLFAAALIFASVAVMALPAVETLFSLVALSFVFGFCDGFSILYRDFLLFSLPKQVLGKASAFSQILNSGSEDLGEFRAGSLAGVMGTGPAIVASAIVGGALSLLYAYTARELAPARPVSSLDSGLASKITGT